MLAIHSAIASQYWHFTVTVQCRGMSGTFTTLGHKTQLRNEGTLVAGRREWQAYMIEVCDQEFSWSEEGTSTLRVTLAAVGPLGSDVLACYEVLYDWLSDDTVH
ncbi:hypothetical protein SPBR_03874 [Sporothrix brasiliensis 5110]|uniref:Uncharacterized protein n=1 Tax=Sporothrix brasiliensis 5110 TaxID=1398154 RepID=A0A0C2FV20_9PEZI|nr:uncharacterized protein SPBR_03874 [Sporothrix brasiliensis 5110]KIH94893.1 hypothetical protein SPBR_03874 [Sporothrix brasiliensis 5110]